MIHSSVSRLLRLSLVLALSLPILSCADLFRSDSEESYRFTTKLGDLSISDRNVFCEDTFVISFDYEDKQNDVIRIILYASGRDRGGSVYDEFDWTGGEGVTHPAEGIGRCSVIWSFPCDRDQAPEDDYTIKVSVIDNNDHESNTLSGTIALQ